ncbi:hypothetical protein [Larkinella soli]|uniref:hypothetical protein n=1 Tax=Larkinella soli TaxID=1770527 RepID=UPI000FFBC76F|nr:hypothetical protein [Larkinella soli]
MKASCQSLTSGLVEVFSKFVDDYQEFRKEAAKVFVTTILPGSSGAEKALDNLIDQAIDLQTSLLKSYGVVVGEGKGKIGPRHQIIPTKRVTGVLKLERTFVVVSSPFDKVTVTIKKTGGKAGADIAVCAKYSNGSIFNEKRKSIEKGEDTIGESVKFVFTDMADKALTIHLVQTGLVTNVCDYDLSIDGAFDEQEMRALYPVRSASVS